MNTLLKSLTAAALVVAPIQAHAGGLAPAIEEAPVIIAEAPGPQTSSSLSSLVVPLIFLGLIGLAASSGTDSDSGGAKDLITGN
ncbi:MAG: hypothetical protein AAFQ64_20020 [Pseudomonadota bacterium]